MKKISMFLLVLQLALTLLVIGCGTTVQPEKIENPGQTQPPPAQETFKIGETVKMGNLQFTLNGVRFDDGGDFFSPNDGERWLVFDCTLENLGSEPTAISSLLMFKLYDANDYAMGLAIGPDLKGSLDGELGAGRRMAGEIGFVVEETEQSWEFIFAPNLFGFGQAIYEINIGEVTS